MQSKARNLNSSCGMSSIVVKPERGKAVLWYNHFLQEDGEPGELDHSTLHGGCGVVRGTKWILTVWINFQFAHERKEVLRGNDCASLGCAAREKDMQSMTYSVEGPGASCRQTY